MRWRTKTAELAAIGDTRTITVFAWWPTKCVGGDTVWLERVSKVQEFQGNFRDVASHWVTLHYHVAINS